MCYNLCDIFGHLFCSVPQRYGLPPGGPSNSATRGFSFIAPRNKCKTHPPLFQRLAHSDFTLALPERSATPFFSCASALLRQNCRVPARRVPGGSPSTWFSNLKSCFNPRSKSFKIRTYRRSPRFSRNWPQVVASNSFGFATYGGCSRKFFRIRTYRKSAGWGTLC